MNNLIRRVRGILTPTFIRFLMVGVFSLFINEGVLILLKGYAGLPLAIASVIAIESPLLIQYELHEHWTFAGEPHNLPTWKRFCTYQTIVVGGLIINWGVLNALADFAGVDYKIANIIAIFIAFGWNYTMNCNVTWKPHSR